MLRGEVLSVLDSERTFAEGNRYMRCTSLLNIETSKIE